MKKIKILSFIFLLTISTSLFSETFIIKDNNGNIISEKTKINYTKNKDMLKKDQGIYKINYEIKTEDYSDKMNESIYSNFKLQKKKKIKKRNYIKKIKIGNNYEK
jgi:hypothetical protein